MGKNHQTSYERSRRPEISVSFSIIVIAGVAKQLVSVRNVVTTIEREEVLTQLSIG